MLVGAVLVGGIFSSKPFRIPDELAIGRVHQIKDAALNRNSLIAIRVEGQAGEYSDHLYENLESSPETALHARQKRGRGEFHPGRGSERKGLNGPGLQIGSARINHYADSDS